MVNTRHDHTDQRARTPHENHEGVEHGVHAGHGAATATGHGDHGGSAAGRTDHPSHDHGDHEAHDAHTGHDMHAGPEGHTGHAGHHALLYRRLFWIALALAVPTVLLSHMFATLLGYGLPMWPWLGWVSPVLGTVVYAWGGRPFLTGAVGEVRSRRPGMMLLVAMAITVAFVASWGATLGLLDGDLDFWWELALLVAIMLLGHWLEMRSLAQTSSALDSLAALLPDEAEKVTPDGTVTVPPAALVVGDVVVVRPGGRVPADGDVVAGAADVDESMITGESRPVARGVDDRVVAGTVATDDALRVRVTAVGEQTALAGIRRLVADAQSSTTRAQLLADRAAALLFWFAVGAAVVTAVAWTVLGTPSDAVIRAITVLVIACPHALGLAIPLVVSISTERAARAGVLVKDRAALERMRSVDAVLFDKTGTLTAGRPVVHDVVAAPLVKPAPRDPRGGPDDPGHRGPAADRVPALAADRVLALAASAEADSQHPLATAVVEAARARGLAVPTASGFSSSTAVGVRADVDGQEVAVGGPNLLADRGLDPLGETATWSERGAIVLHVLVDGVVVGALALADEVRPQARAAADALHRRGVRTVMITGDAEPVARAVAAELGIDQVFAGVRPEHKAARVVELQRAGRTVAMVGDGVNDAPALAQADVGIAIGAGTDVAIASAGVILASDDPRSVLSVIELSRAGYRTMRQNLWWAAGYNLAAVPLAAGVLAGVGFVLPMEVGALLMSVSTIVVAANAQLLRRLDLRPGAVTG
ncbi:HAD-IC family P-type ATPase [Xylanimonas protaetiae]|uniref:HAD family hydrolase n=1 Tax=Xylanimonas protaetiae TaxID=2509457 RepID=A0A4P6F2Z0_9MICO|nr:HAD-IC family P-type ATPase [Xylanimonas protaetiae]QAY69626.1 HAD family hydrolase [Xylanimonas protaetiae]